MSRPARDRLGSGLPARGRPGPAGCGISPTGVQDEGRPPVISYSPTWVTVYLLRDGRLEPVRIPVASDSAKNIVATLFRAGKQPPEPGLTSALNGFSHYDTETTRYSDDADQRNEPGGQPGLPAERDHHGRGRAQPAGLAQITCTIRQNKQESIWSVEVTRLFPGAPRRSGEHSLLRVPRPRGPRRAAPPVRLSRGPAPSAVRDAKPIGGYRGTRPTLPAARRGVGTVRA